MFYDETAVHDENPSQTAYLASIKTDFLEKMNSELDTLIGKLKK
ncbi:hypothetical protein AGMMS49587_01270 [Spirochaetia bacterium]|nr:hypothetical protein AGMMS49587_01270 [Spirochaetia bacterium]